MVTLLLRNHIQKCSCRIIIDKFDTLRVTMACCVAESIGDGWQWDGGWDGWGWGRGCAGGRRGGRHLLGGALVPRPVVLRVARLPLHRLVLHHPAAILRVRRPPQGLVRGAPQAAPAAPHVRREDGRHGALLLTADGWRLTADGWQRPHQRLTADADGWQRPHQRLTADADGWQRPHQTLTVDADGWQRLHQRLTADVDGRLVLTAGWRWRQADADGRLMLKAYRADLPRMLTENWLSADGWQHRHCPPADGGRDRVIGDRRPRHRSCQRRQWHTVVSRTSTAIAWGQMVRFSLHRSQYSDCDEQHGHLEVFTSGYSRCEAINGWSLPGNTNKRLSCAVTRQNLKFATSAQHVIL